MLNLVAAVLATTIPPPECPASRGSIPDDVCGYCHTTITSPDPQTKIELGKQLFFEVALSGNRNISCADCHHPLTNTADGLSLPIGEGGVGLGVTRTLGDTVARVPRNSPAIFALANATALFWDGRIEPDPTMPSGIQSPAGEQLPDGLDSLLAAQALFPVTSADEMAGHGAENDLAVLADKDDVVALWEALALRLRQLPYADLFVEAFGLFGTNQITMVHAANAIAAFEIDAWSSTGSPFSRFLAGDMTAMSPEQVHGYAAFHSLGCIDCHNGPHLTDWGFRAIGMPQIGPGKQADRQDTGRDGSFRFRTPPLTNVALTAPYGHSGAFQTLEGVIRHHLDPWTSLYGYDCRSAPTLVSRPDLDAIDCAVMDDLALVDEIAGAIELDSQQATDSEVADLVAFMHALTDPAHLDLRGDVP